MTNRKSQHVVRNPDGGWSVKKEGASKASGRFSTQADAVKSAKKISKTQGSSVVVHGRNGRIQEVTAHKRTRSSKPKKS